MIIRSVKHRGLRRLILDDDASGLPAQYIGKIRNIIAFLQDMDREDELRLVPTWKAHQLTGLVRRPNYRCASVAMRSASPISTVPISQRWMRSQSGRPARKVAIEPAMTAMSALTVTLIVI